MKKPQKKAKASSILYQIGHIQDVELLRVISKASAQRTTVVVVAQRKQREEKKWLELKPGLHKGALVYICSTDGLILIGASGRQLEVVDLYPRLRVIHCQDVISGRKFELHIGNLVTYDIRLELPASLAIVDTKRVLLDDAGDEVDAYDHNS